MTFLHELPDWPAFDWDHRQLIDRLASVRYRQGKLNGRMESLGQKFRDSALAEILTDEVVSASALDHITLDKTDVRTSIAKKLGKDFKGWVPQPHVEAPVTVLLDASSNFLVPLTEVRLLGWHSSLLLAAGQAHGAGAWRTGQAAIASPSPGSSSASASVFEAPYPARIGPEMASFLEWVEANLSTDPVLRAGLAHLWFMTVLPFSAGNYRIAAAITSMALARAEGCPRQYISLSGQIDRNGASYRCIVQKTQTGTLDVTEWLLWFFDCFDKAIAASEAIWERLHSKAQAEEQLSSMSLNDRQLRMLKLLRSGMKDQLTSGWWASMTNSSPDSALRDIKELVDLGLLKRNEGGGRSTSYSLVE